LDGFIVKIFKKKYFVFIFISHSIETQPQTNDLYYFSSNLNTFPIGPRSHPFVGGDKLANVVLHNCSESGVSNVGGGSYICDGGLDSGFLNCFDPSSLVVVPGCDQESCGPYGNCLQNSGFCICQSSFEPSNDLLSCSSFPSCQVAEYSNISYLLDSQVYTPTINILFESAKIVVSNVFDQAQNLSRNLKITSRSGQVCQEMIKDMDQITSLSQQQWFQSVVEIYAKM
jgi:hypothetical protein